MLSNFVRVCVTNLVSVLPATPHCKPNHPVHPHFKPKSGLVDSAGGYIEATRLRQDHLVPRCQAPCWAAPDTWPGREVSLRRHHWPSDRRDRPKEEWPRRLRLTEEWPIRVAEEECILHPPSTLSIYPFYLSPSSIFFLYLLLPKEVSPVGEVIERRSPSSTPAALCRFFVSDSHPVNLCSTGLATYHGERIRSWAR